MFFVAFLINVHSSIAQNWQSTSGNYSTGNLGLGINYVPTNYKLHVEGKLFAQQLQIGTGGIAGQVLTLDALGNAVWSTPASSSNGWLLAGNALTASNQFIGSTSATYPLRISANNDTRIFMPVMLNNQHTVTIGAASRNPYYYQFEVNGGKTALIGPNSGDQSNILQIISGYNNPNFLTGTIHYMSFSHERFLNNEEHGVINAYQYTNPSGPGVAKHLIFQKYSGNIGIGNFTSAPTEKLEVIGNIRATGDIIFNGNQRLSQIINSSGFWLSNGSSISSTLGIAVGRVGIPYGYIAAFDGKIRARGMRCDQDYWADDVFSSDYYLMPMDSLSQYISENKHLPGIPTTVEVQKNGVDMAEINEQLLRKVEENTLYVLQLKAENDALKKEMEEIKNLLLIIYAK